MNKQTYQQKTKKNI